MLFGVRQAPAPGAALREMRSSSPLAGRRSPCRGCASGSPGLKWKPRNCAWPAATPATAWRPPSLARALSGSWMWAGNSTSSASWSGTGCVIDAIGTLLVAVCRSEDLTMSTCLCFWTVKTLTDPDGLPPHRFCTPHEASAASCVLITHSLYPPVTVRAPLGLKICATPDLVLTSCRAVM